MTMEVCKEVQQTRIKALAKQAGGHIEFNAPYPHVVSFSEPDLAEFVRLVREEHTTLLQDILHDLRTRNYKNQTLNIVNKIHMRLKEL